MRLKPTDSSKKSIGRKDMTGKWNTWVGAGALAVFLVCGTTLAVAQPKQSRPDPHLGPAGKQAEHLPESGGDN